jgi:signal transduction histidine kinase
VTHEFNNFLNTVMLQSAVMELTAPEPLKADLQGLKRQGKQAAGVIRQLQLYRRRKERTPAPADLSRAAAAAAAVAEDGSLNLDLADGLPLVGGPAADLRRMCRFLLGGTTTVTAGGTRKLTTRLDGQNVRLQLEITPSTGGALARLLDGPLWADGVVGLELAACQSLVRRLGGSVRAEATADGEALLVDLPAAV